MTDDTRPSFGDAPDDHAFLSGYLDGELAAEERVQVDARLAASVELRAELDEITVARAAVRGLPRRDAPAGFWDTVFANLEAADDERADTEGATVVAIEPRRNRKSRAGWIAGAAAVAAAVIAVVVVPGRTAVRPNVTAVATQHGATTSDVGDSISSLVPMGPLAGRR
jgi:anti-sigma factor RsiW